MTMSNDNLMELKRIRDVANIKATSIQTDCIECGKEISLELNREDLKEDELNYKTCCDIMYCLEKVIDLGVYRMKMDE